MIAVSFIILLFITFFVGLMTYINRKKKTEEVETTQPVEECCGTHEVCERDTLLISGNKIVYYDDEELDGLSNIAATDFTDEQQQQLSDVFYTLNENDVSGWLRSLQMRHIELPDELKDAALLIVRERRSVS